MGKTALCMFMLLVALSGCSIVVLAQNSAQVVVDAYPNTAMVEQGTTLVLVCRVVGVPSTTVLSYQWTCPGGSCDAGAVDPEWAAKVQQGNILLVNVRNGNDTGDYTCTVMGSSTQLASGTHSVTVTDGLSFLNEDGGSKVFFPRNSFVTNTTLTSTNSPRNRFPDTGIGNDHIACYGGDPNAAQVTWHNSSGGALGRCLGVGPDPQPVPCEGCGPICENNSAVGVDPSLNGHTSIHLFTDDPRYVNQDLQCQVNGGQSAFIGVYVMNGVSTLSTPSMLMTSGATTTTTVSVSWSPVSGATGYYVSYQRQDLGAPPVVTPQYERIVGGANTSVTLSGLEPGTTYRIRVWSTNGTSVSSEAGEMDVTTVESAPSPPRMLTVIGEPTGSTVELNWLPPLHPNGAICYEIEYEPSVTPGDPVNAGNSNTPYFTLTLPNEFVTYNITIAAVNILSMNSAQSVLPVCPGRNREGTVPPSGVSVAPNGCDSAEVTWRAPNSGVCDGVVSGYNVRYRLSSSTGDYTAVNTSDARATLQNLTPNEEYTVEVAIITSVGGIGSYSTVAQFNITDPAPPTGLSVVTGTECNTADVSWSPSTVNYNAVIGNYSVRYWLRGSSGYTTVYSPTTSITLRGLDPGAEYDVEVAAVDLCGRTSGLSEVAGLNLEAPEPPTAVSVKDGAGCYSSMVSWVAPQARCGVAIATYSVRYQQRKGGGGGGYTTVSSPTTSVTLQRITANSDYDVSVAAISSSGDMGIFTEAIQFELQEPKPPTDVSLTIIGKDTAVVTWAASRSMCDNVVGNYSVRYRLRDTSASSRFTTVYTTTTSVVLQGLVPDAEYTMSVAAINSKGDMSAYSVGDMCAPSTTTMGNPTCPGSQTGSAGAVAGAATGGFIGGLLLTAAIAGGIALVVLCRAKRRGTIKLDTKDALYEDPNLLDQLQANPAYGMGPASTVKVEKGDEEYETCDM